MYEYNLHDCWAVHLDKDHYEFVLGGADPDDPRQGVLFAERPRGSVATSKFPTPSKDGDVTVLKLTWERACLKTASGRRASFNMDTLRFEAGAEAGRLCN